MNFYSTLHLSQLLTKMGTCFVAFKTCGITGVQNVLFLRISRVVRIMISVFKRMLQCNINLCNGGKLDIRVIIN